MTFVCVPWWDDVDVRDPRAVGRWGEALVYQYLLQRYPGWRVTCPTRRRRVRGFTTSSSNLPRRRRTAVVVVFIEVKTMRWADRNAFELSLWEWTPLSVPGWIRLSSICNGG